MKLAYIAGRYRGPTQSRVKMNIRAAEHVGWLVRELGHYPVIPHANTYLFEELEENQTVDRFEDDNLEYPSPGADFYLEGTLELMRRCDFLVMVPGWADSSGAIEEKAEAEKLGIPVYFDIRDVPCSEVIGHVI